MQRPESSGRFREQPVVNSVQGSLMTLSDAREITTHEIASRFDVIAAGDGVVLLRDLADTRTYGPADIRELGSTGQTKWSDTGREDYNGQWRKPTNFDNIDKMRKGDAAVRATLRLMKTPITSARWFMLPASKAKGDRDIAKKYWKVLTCYQQGYWNQFLLELLLFLDYGFYPFEKVFVRDAEGEIQLKYFSPRHPRDLYQWQYDPHGQLTGGEWYRNLASADRVFIKYPNKLINFAFDSEGGNPEGISVLRSAYKHWYYKENLYKIDAIQKERHGIGIPVIKLPMNFNVDDKRLAQELGRNLRTNEKAHVVLPPMFELLMLKLEGQPVDAMESAKHHNDMIAMNILAMFLTSQGDMANETTQNLFLRSLRYIAEYVAEIITYNMIAQMVYWNEGANVEFPTLKVRRIGDTVDWRTLSFAVRNLVGAGIITPDDSLEEWFRDEMDLSQWDPNTSRDLATPQGQKQAEMDQAEEMQEQMAKQEQTGPGLPRQGNAAGMQRTKGPGKKNTGQDTSGGN